MPTVEERDARKEACGKLLTKLGFKKEKLSKDANLVVISFWLGVVHTQRDPYVELCLDSGRLEELVK